MLWFIFLRCTIVLATKVRRWLRSRMERVYDRCMSVETFTAANGQEVAKVVTPSGVTGYIATGIPREALIAMRDKLLANLGLTHEEFVERYGSSEENR